MSTPKVLECEFCHRKFSEKDIEDLNFFVLPKAQGCFRCYDAGRRKGHREWCFGKTNVADPKTGTIKQYGYDPMGSSDCRKYCNDRKLCQHFATGKIDTYRALIRSRIPYRSGSVSARAFVLCVLGTTWSKLKDLVESMDKDPMVMLEKFRKQRSRSGTFKWKFIEDGSKLKIRM